MDALAGDLSGLDFRRIDSQASYELVREIGRGSFAGVYLARRSGVGLERYVAIKVVDLKGMNKRQRAILMDEARITGALSHPNILHVYDCGTLGERWFFLVCELMDGYTLKDVIARHTQRVMERLKGSEEIPVSLMKHAVASILMHTAHGLQYMHDAQDILTGASIRVIHNDLKPSNIIIGMDGALKVADFGISYSLLRKVRLKGGTPAYMSPEWIGAMLDKDSRHTPGPALDIYSLGICLHETLTDRRLFRAPREGMAREEVMVAIHGQMRNLKKGFTRIVNPAADPHLSAIVDRCLAFEPTERYASVREIIDELDGLISRGVFHPEIFDRRFLAEYMVSLFMEGGLRRFWKASASAPSP